MPAEPRGIAGNIVAIKMKGVPLEHMFDYGHQDILSRFLSAMVAGQRAKQDVKLCNFLRMLSPRVSGKAG